MNGHDRKGADGWEDHHIVLVGMMGSGKTTTARAIAERLAWPLRDCDEDLEARVGMSGAQVAVSQGIDVLHDLEEEVLLDALVTTRPAVIAAAGWVVEAERCRHAMTEHAHVVWLDAPIDALVARMATSDHRRRLERGPAEALLTRRRPWLEELVDLHLDALQSTDVLADQVVAAVHQAPAAPHGRSAADR